MFLPRFFRIIAAVAISFAACMPVYAEPTTAQSFLSWERKAQDSFTNNSVVMATVIASQVRKDLAACILGWYNDNPATMDIRRREITSQMGKHPNSHPSAVILALIQKNCGKFK